MSDAVPKVFGPYEVHERLGVGGMATVHRAVLRDAGDKASVVALKRLLPHLAEDADFVEAFIQEARLSALLRHPNIAAMHELGKVGDSYFMAMEYVSGRDLRKCLRQARRAAGPPPLQVLLTIAHQIADALDYAHGMRDEAGRALGLVHRDISPSNILVSDAGDVKLIDFGIAKATAVHATRTGTIKGKLAYMAPEALDGEQDGRSDLFSVGVVLHEMLTARPLFADKSDLQVIRNLENLQPPAPSRFNTQCPREVDAFVLRTLEKSRDQRWASAAAMRDAVDELCTELGVQRSPAKVAGWIEWAFSLPVPERPPQRYTDVDSSISSISFTTGPHSGPTGVSQPGQVQSLLPPMRADSVEELSDLDDMMWAEGDSNAAIDAVVVDLPLPRAGTSVPPPVPPPVPRARATGPLTPPSFGPAGRNPADLDLITFRTPTQPPPIAPNSGGSGPIAPVLAPAARRGTEPPRARTSSFVPIIQPDEIAASEPLARWKSLIVIAICVVLAIAVGIAIASL